jgi:hypothetical protein
MTMQRILDNGNDRRLPRTVNFHLEALADTTVRMEMFAIRETAAAPRRN